jgi:uncharacterized repeat protein (TIGR01451 family)
MSLVSLSLLAVTATASAAPAPCRGSCADLSVGVNDLVSSVVPGHVTIYAVTVRNGGPSTVGSVSLTDLVPAALKGVLYAPLSGSYNPATHVWSGINLPSGRTAAMLIGGTVDPAATGALVNTISVGPPAGAIDPDPSNNSATDTDTLTPQSDLSVSETDGISVAVPGRSDVYTLTVRNGGPSTVSGLSLTDSLATALGGVVFAPSAGAYNATTHVWSGLALAAGQSVTMKLTGTIPPAATGTLVNAVTVAPATGSTDPVASNNTVTDTDTLAPQADLSISKSDHATTAAPGGSTTYSIAVSNTGPSSVSGATVKDTMPAAIASDTWTASNGASGSGNVNATTAIAAGTTVTYTVVAAIGASATGSLTNSATVTSPSGVPDANQSNNSATDTDSLVPQADLSITESDGATVVTAGTSTTYSIAVSNAGPSPVAGAVVQDALPAAIASDTWTASNGTSGSGNVNATLALASGATVTYTVVANVSTSATGSLANTATVAVPAGVTDPNPANNSATDTDTLTPLADLSATVSDGADSVSQGASDTYTIVVSNAGPNAVSGASVSDAVPAAIDGATWTATATSGSSVADATGSGDIATTVSLLAGGSATYTLTGFVDATATGNVTDSATAGTPAGVSDPNPANNTNTDTDSITVATGTPRVKFGDLTLCNLPVLPKLDYLTVRQFYHEASRWLGGDPTVYDPAELDTIAADLNGAFDPAPSQFALDHLSTDSGCAPVAWQKGDLTTYADGDFGVELGPTQMTDYDFANVYAPASEFGELTVGDTDPGRSSITFERASDVFGYLPADGAAGVLGSSSTDPTTTSAGVFGGDMVTLRLNIDFSDAYAPRTCKTPGTPTCAWGIGDLVTYGQAEWASDGTAQSILDHFGDVYNGNPPRGFELSIGDDDAGFRIGLTSETGVLDFLPTGGPPGVLTGTAVNPDHHTSSGVFGGDVTALLLDIDFIDAGYLAGITGDDFGDLTVCNLTAPAGVNGMTVRQIAALAKGVIGGVDTTYTPAQFDPLVSALSTAFPSGELTDMSSHLFIGACP